MNSLYIIKNSSQDDYENHKFLKLLFPSEGKLLFKTNHDTHEMFVSTNINPDENIQLLENVNFVATLDESLISDLKDKRVSFLISLNPVKNLYGKKIAYKTNDEIHHYVIKKIENIGISFNDTDVKILRHYVKKCIRKGNELKFNAVDVYVECEIKDIDKFKNALENGVGSCKMCGFGLIDMQTVQ